MKLCYEKCHKPDFKNVFYQEQTFSLRCNYSVRNELKGEAQGWKRHISG